MNSTRSGKPIFALLEFLWSFPNAAFKIVSLFVLSTLVLSCALKANCGLVPFSTLRTENFELYVIDVWCLWLRAHKQCLKLLNSSDLPSRKLFLVTAFPTSLSARSFVVALARPGQQNHTGLRRQIQIWRWMSEPSHSPDYPFHFSLFVVNPTVAEARVCIMLHVPSVSAEEQKRTTVWICDVFERRCL